ncbi:hypothetical protein [Aquipuribacter nitratireducens]|uniref:Uncharacterized protein n=1 Tax=Aquipuribacter nitratireducens TaxID=650104 RepID=A0ABW0GTJ6_9MICO
MAAETQRPGDDGDHGFGPHDDRADTPGADDVGGGAVPADVMSESRRDATAVLVTWVLRRSFWTLLLLGLAYGWLAGAVTPVALVRLDDPLRLFAALATPLAGIAVAIGFRVAVDLAALVVAFPRTRWVVTDRTRRNRHTRAPVRRWVDRLYMTTAYRELRSTWTVRGRAATHLGHSGPWLTALNVLLWLTTALAAAVLVVAVAETEGMVPARLGVLLGFPLPGAG